MVPAPGVNSLIGDSPTSTVTTPVCLFKQLVFSAPGTNVLAYRSLGPEIPTLTSNVSVCILEMTNQS